MRFDAADFPMALSATGRLDNSWDVTLNVGGRVVQLAHVRGAYYRRPTKFGCRLTDESEQAWAQAEARAGLGGLLLASVPWMNHPHRSGYADYRPVQLMAARLAGLLVPPTLITNDPDQARAFLAEQGELIYKPMTHASPGDGQFVYATPITASELVGEDGEALAGTMHLGALDFLVTADGEWYFLEVNPNGQWAWIEQETGLPISEAIADALLTPELAI